MGDSREGGKSLDFVEAACAMHCGLGDADHEKLLARVRDWVRRDPEVPQRDFLAAVVTGEASVVRTRLEASPELATKKGGPRNWDPLLYLCFSRFFRDREDRKRQAGLLETAGLLLRAGANPNTFFLLGQERETALYAAVGVNNHPELARLLLRAGAEVNDADGSYHVAEFEDLECVRVLFEHGLDADHRATVLLRKLDFDDLEGLRQILAFGADPNHPGRWGKMALHQAVMRGRSLPFVRTLLEAGADPEALTASGKSVLYLASRYGRRDVVAELERRGIDDTKLAPEDSFIAACGVGKAGEARTLLQENPGLFESLSPDSKLAIVDAARAGSVDGVGLMLELGFDLAVQDSQGFTPLHWAAWYGHLELVAFLVEKGAPLEVENSYGGTVLDAAVWGYANSDGVDRHASEIIDVLVGAGADIFRVTPFPSGHEVSDAVLLGHGRGEPKK